jgi:hypothetical protein
MELVPVSEITIICSLQNSSGSELASRPTLSYLVTLLLEKENKKNTKRAYDKKILS